MATIYRFIVEQRASKSGDGRKSSDGGSKKSAAKKAKTVSWGNLGPKGGVEHNRKMRAANPLFNRVTGGYAEKVMRLSRAGLGLVKLDAETGKFAGFSGPAVAIIIAFVLQVLMKWQKQELIKAEKQNEQNYKQLENGLGAVHGQYKISTNIVTGRHTYNQNK